MALPKTSARRRPCRSASTPKVVMLVAGPVSRKATAAPGDSPVNSQAAEAALYPAQGAEVTVLAGAGLSEAEAEILRQVGATQKYYGAIAISPSEGLASEATVAGAVLGWSPAARRAVGGTVRSVPRGRGGTLPSGTLWIEACRNLAR